MMVPRIDLREESGRRKFQKLLERLRATVELDSPQARLVRRIIGEVKREGDRAVVRYMRKWTDPGFTAERICVSQGELERAKRAVPGELRRRIRRAIAHVWAYQRHILPGKIRPVTIDGAWMGLRFVPVESVGLLVPGGRAAYPSSLIMQAVPAMVAGVPVERISLASPPPTRRGREPEGDISPLVLATAAMLGIRRVYRLGGAQAVAALALGTERVGKVDMVVGPGNVFVQLAKLQLQGLVGVDGFYGPSEILTIADPTADPVCVAADLIAQAEHDPGRCFLVSWSDKVIDAVLEEMRRQIRERRRRKAIEAALKKESAVIRVRDEEEAAEVANRIAAEHVNLAVADPLAWLRRVRHGGEFFLSDRTPVAAGDYYAGPSHCLPTGSTARFASGLSVYTFLKRSGIIWYRRGMSRQTAEAIAALAEAEGLDGHAWSARVRGARRMRGAKNLPEE